MLVKNGMLFTDQGLFSRLDMEFGNRITAIGNLEGDSFIDAEGKYVIPGLIDIHTHGAVNEDASDGKIEGLERLSQYYAYNGVTSWCPTVMTLGEMELVHAMHAVRDFRSKGARCIGINLEGPFLSYDKRGAQAAENLHKPDVDLFYRLQEASGNRIALVTVAAEVAGALDFIRDVSKICTVSLGHSSAAYEEAMAAYAAGATHTTHLFNGMEGLHHRRPAIPGAAFDADEMVERIWDGLHLHPAVIRMAHSLYPMRFVLISDSLRCAGMEDGHYTLGGQPIVMKNGMATLDNGTGTLAGSSISILKALQNAVSFGVPIEAAILAATITPARVIRRADDIGSLSIGKYADFVILDKDLNLEAVYIGGNKIERALLN